MPSELETTYQKLNNEIYLKVGQRDTLSRKLSRSKERLLAIDKDTDTLSKASVFLQTLSDTTRQQIIDRISNIVTDALQKVKDHNLEFRMLLSTERNQMDVKFVVFDKITQREYDILDSCGGSIAEIVSFPLKISLLLKWEPPLSRLLILDETFKFLSVIDQELMGDFVRQVSEKLNLQIILITHSEIISQKANAIFLIEKVNGISRVFVR